MASEKIKYACVHDPAYGIDAGKMQTICHTLNSTLKLLRKDGKVCGDDLEFWCEEKLDGIYVWAEATVERKKETPDVH